MGLSDALRRRAARNRARIDAARKQRPTGMEEFEDKLKCDGTSDEQCGMTHITVDIEPGGHILVTGHGTAEIAATMIIHAAAFVVDECRFPRTRAAAELMLAKGNRTEEEQ